MLDQAASSQAPRHLLQDADRERGGRGSWDSVATLPHLDALLAYMAGESHVRAAAALALRNYVVARVAPGPVPASCVADTLHIDYKKRVMLAGAFAALCCLSCVCVFVCVCV